MSERTPRWRLVAIATLTLLGIGLVVLHQNYPLHYIYRVVKYQGPDFYDFERFPAQVKAGTEIFPADWLAQSQGQVASVFSLLTFALMPLTFGFNGIVSADLIRVPATRSGIQVFLEFSAGLALLAPVATAWLAKQRKEGLVNGAEACAAVALCFFFLLAVIRVIGG